MDTYGAHGSKLGSIDAQLLPRPLRCAGSLRCWPFRWRCCAQLHGQRRARLNELPGLKNECL